MTPTIGDLAKYGFLASFGSLMFACSKTDNDKSAQLLAQRTLTVTVTREFEVPLAAGETYLVIAQQNGADVRLEVANPLGVHIAESDVDTQLRGPESAVFTARSTGNYQFSVAPTITSTQATVDVSVFSLPDETRKGRRRIAAEQKIAGALTPTTTWDPVYWRPLIDDFAVGRRELCELDIASRCAHITAMEAWLRYKYLEQWGIARTLSDTAATTFGEESRLDRANALSIHAMALIESDKDEAPEAVAERRKLAEPLFVDIVSIQRKQGANADASWTRNAHGTSLYYQGRQVEAELAFLDAINLAQEAGATKYVQLFSKNFAVIARSDEYSKNLQTLESVAESLDQSDNPEFFGITQFQLGERYLELGRWSEAISALALAKESLTLPSDQVLVSIELARAYLDAGRLSRSRTYLRQAQDLQTYSNEAPVRLRLVLLGAEIAEAEHNPAEEIGLEEIRKLELALQDTQLRSGPRDEGLLATALSRLYLLSNRPDDAVHSSELAVKRLQNADDTPELIQAQIVAAKARISRRATGDLDIADVHLSQANELLKRVALPVPIAETAALQAQLASHNGDMAAAIRASDLGIQKLWEQRYSVRSDSYRFGQLQRSSDIYVQHADLLYTQAKDEQDPAFRSLFLFVDALKGSRVYQKMVHKPGSGSLENDSVRGDISRLTRELALASGGKDATANLENLLESAYLIRDVQDSSVTGEPQIGEQRLGEIQASIPANTVLLQYWLKGSVAILWIVDRNRFEAIELGRSDDIRDLLREFHRSLSTAQSSTSELQKRLRALLAPTRALTDSTEHIVVVPDAESISVPMALLFDSRYSLSRIQAPSLISIPKAATARPDSIALFGNPEYSDSTELAQLPGAEAEVQSISNGFPWRDSAHWTGAAATREKFLKVASDYDVLHVAAHGEFDLSNPLLSGIAFSDVNASNAFLTLADIQSMDLTSVRLLVLSGCKTAFGEASSLEGVAGFPAEAIAAGADKVLVSLWDIPDQATRQLMQTFYAGVIDEGLEPAAALRFAQEEVRGIGKWHHPMYWGAWVLVGS